MKSTSKDVQSILDTFLLIKKCIIKYTKYKEHTLQNIDNILRNKQVYKSKINLLLQLFIKIA